MMPLGGGAADDATGIMGAALVVAERVDGLQVEVPDAFPLFPEDSLSSWHDSLPVDAVYLSYFVRIFVTQND